VLGGPGGADKRAAGMRGHDNGWGLGGGRLPANHVDKGGGRRVEEGATGGDEEGGQHAVEERPTDVLLKNGRRGIEPKVKMNPYFCACGSLGVRGTVGLVILRDKVRPVGL
jgi:hypothetical protein